MERWSKVLKKSNLTSNPICNLSYFCRFTKWGLEGLKHEELEGFSTMRKMTKIKR